VSDEESGEGEGRREAETMKVLTQDETISSVTLTIEYCVFDGVEVGGRSRGWESGGLT
jgi:hypothetical protein